ncbi:hypothetical protein BC830DRAFT_1141896, partial [Chytriomyces sp. MP71]
MADACVKASSLVPLARMDTQLISADGFEFIIDRKCAMAYGISKLCSQDMQNEVTFRDIKAVVVDKDEIPEFPIDMEVAPELQIAADFLDC